MVITKIAIIIIITTTEDNSSITIEIEEDIEIGILVIQMKETDSQIKERTINIKESILKKMKTKTLKKTLEIFSKIKDR